MIMRVKPRIALCALLQVLGLLAFPFSMRAQASGSEEGNPIRIGVLLEDSLSVQARSGAELALREINARGGLSGRELQLLYRSMEGPWGRGSKQAVDLIFENEAWALVGASQGRNAHLIEQVIAKTSIVFVSAWTADPTLTKAYVPHFFNLVPNSEQQADAILKDLNGRREDSGWILVSDRSYDSKKAVEGITGRELYSKNPPLERLICESVEDGERAAQTILRLKARAVVIFCEPAIGWRIIRSIRAGTGDAFIYGNLALLDENDPESTNRPDLDRILVPAYGNRGFADPKAAYTYDAVHLLADAIVKCGFDRSKLRKTVSESNCEGETGKIEFDALGNRKGLPGLIELSSENFLIPRP